MSTQELKLDRIRVGNFTSSNIHRLTKLAKDKVNFGAPALEYIKEVNFERKIQRPLEKETDAKALTWGKCLEKVAFDALGLEYKLHSNTTIQHPTLKSWYGTPDATKGAAKTTKAVGDLKCPFTMKSYCNAITSTNVDVFREEHKDGEKYYWQVVSNGILTGSKFGEIIFFMPYARDMDKIKKHSIDMPYTKDKNEYAWIFHTPIEELPYLPDGCGVSNLHKIVFEIPKADIDFLTDRVTRAEGLLWKR